MEFTPKQSAVSKHFRAFLQRLNTPYCATFNEQHFYFDRLWVSSLGVIVALGLIILASASIPSAGERYHYPFYFLIKQLIFLAISLLAGTLTLRLPVASWYRGGVNLILISILMLIAVLIPGIGTRINGSSRWLNLYLISFQVSELIKISMVIYLAGYLVRQQTRLYHLSNFIKPLVLLTLIATLLLLEPDFGSVIVIGVTMLAMLYLGGVSSVQFMMVWMAVIMLALLIALISPYRVARIVSFLNPWSHAFSGGYQLTQALIAFGRGGWLGVGLGNSIQKLFYLPEAHTDFLFAVLAEEMGWVGQFGLMICFSIVVMRSLRTALMAAKLQRWFTCFLTAGLAINLALQVLINVGVNLGVLPTKGLALPFISYGGSNLFFNTIGMAIVARSYHEVTECQQKQLTRG